MSKIRLNKTERSEQKAADKLDRKELKEKKHIEKLSRKSHSKSKRKMKGFGTALLSALFQILHIISDKIINFILELYWGEKKTCPELNKNFFITKSCVELANLIRKQELKSEILVKAYVERIKETNPVLNFITDGPFEDAIEQARAVDQRISNGLVSEDEFSEKPFLGVPFTTKDSTACKGKLHTLGLISRRNIMAKEDAECIRLMKEAGGILIATTNIPEVNKWQETRNNVFGQTNNPYDSRRTVGGSSGGESCAIASCSTAFGIGTDIGGSVRMPAFYCGIFGHKPTSNVINAKGCTFRTGHEPTTMVVVGPMTRYASDLLPLFRVLVGPENCILLRLDDKPDLKKLKYYYITENGEFRTPPISSDLKGAMNRVVTHFSNLSEHPVKQTKLTGTEFTSKLWRYWISQEPANFNELLGNGVDLNPIMETLKKIIGQSDFTLASIYSLIDSKLPKENARKMRELTKICEDELNELLGEDGILFYHSATYPAPFHYHALLKMYNFSYWGIFNVLHVPATQVPLGLNSNGLPLGIQVVASKNRDRHCLAVAQEIENVFGGWKPPFQFKN